MRRGSGKLSAPSVNGVSEFSKQSIARWARPLEASATLEDLVCWKVERLAQGVDPADPFVVSLRSGRQGTLLSRHTLRKRFRTACKVLGPDRLEGLTIHYGRHTDISHALGGGHLFRFE